jgi:hypothetical protein
MRECVENGARYVPRRCDKAGLDLGKLDEDGDIERFAEIVAEEVMNFFSEYFSWDDEVASEIPACPRGADSEEFRT